MKNVFRALSALTLVCALPHAAAADRWSVRAAAGMAVADTRGSAIEASLMGEVRPDLRVGLEAGLCKMSLGPAPGGGTTVDAAFGGGRLASSLTDGITRNRVFFLGPEVRWGSSIYAIASYGIADVRGNNGPADYIQGGSVGVGIGGSGRFQPSAELRHRFVADAPPFGSRRASEVGDALTLTVGLNLR
jgi:hypothetical protein